MFVADSPSVSVLSTTPALYGPGPALVYIGPHTDVIFYILLLTG